MIEKSQRDYCKLPQIACHDGHNLLGYINLITNEFFHLGLVCAKALVTHFRSTPGVKKLHSSTPGSPQEFKKCPGAPKEHYRSTLMQKYMLGGAKKSKVLQEKFRCVINAEIYSRNGPGAPQEHTRSTPRAPQESPRNAQDCPRSSWVAHLPWNPVWVLLNQNQPQMTIYIM